FSFNISLNNNPFVVDLKTALGSNMSKKKAPKDAFHGPASGSFIQKKKVVLGNVKHSGDERDISLSKSGLDNSVYSNVDSLSGDDKDVGMTDVYGESLLDSAVTTPKAKRVDTGTMFGSPLGSPDFIMDNDEIVLPPRVSISLEKKWIDPKIVKTQVEVSVKKSFALDINFSAVEDKSATTKTQVIRKLFSKINSFGEATTLSKFEGIIRSTFTLLKSMEKAASLARENNIIVNNQTVVIKEIPMNMLKDMIIIAVAKFGEIKSIRVQLIGLWQKAVVEFTKSSQADMLALKWSFLIKKDSVCVAKAVKDRDIWAFRDYFRALLFTLPVRTTAHNLSNLLDNTNDKTCIINHLLDTGNRVHCAVVGFESENDLDSAFLTKSIFGGVHLSWTRLDLVWYRKYGHLGHLALKCDVSDMSPSNLLSLFNKKRAPGVDCLQLAKLYIKKNVPIFCPAAFGGKSWTQVVSLTFSSGGFPSGSDLGVGFSPLATLGLGNSFSFSIINDSFLNARLASLEHSLELLAEQVSDIVRKLSFVELVPVISSVGALLLVGSVPLVPVLDSDMALDGELASSTLYPSSANLGAGFSSSSSKVLTTKMSGLESKMLALKASVNSVLARLDLLCSGLGINVSAKQVDVLYWHVKSGLMVFFITETKLNVGVAIIMNNSLAHHVSKVEEVPGQVIAVRFLFRNKLSVSVIGLYADASSGVCFSQTSEVNSLIAKAVNSSTFVVLGGDFNKNRSERSASFKFCSGLGLVNSFSNSRGVKKTIDFIFVSENLVSAVAGHRVGSVSDFFDTDHNAVIISIDLGGLLNIRLNSLRKQANKDCWKFNIKNADDAGWSHFRDCSSVMILGVIDKFHNTAAELNLDIMWLLLEKMLSTLDANKALVLVDIVQFGQRGVDILKFLSFIKREYRKSKMYESKLLQKASIRNAIEKHMKKFCSDKGSMIRSILDWPFQKVVLDHLVVNNELVLEPEEVKLKIDEIMEGWTRKQVVPLVLPDLWAHQYASLAHIKDDTFSGVMNAVSLNELLLVIGGLPDSKATGLSDISNEL
ncbi:hypothetical protein G9A89_022784, partial [Geosiphon pyriformis]